MALIRIAESLHCHIPLVGDSARRWLCGDALDHESAERHFRRIVEDQAAAGAEYLDVNADDLFIEEGIGHEGARELLAHLLGVIVRYGKGIPPCIDSSDPEFLAWGLERYVRMSKDGPHPLLNSVTATRLDPLELRKHFQFSIVGMLLERAGESTGFTDIADAEVYYETAKFVFEKARAAGFAPEEIFFDPTVGPLGADMVVVNVFVGTDNEDLLLRKLGDVATSCRCWGMPLMAEMIPASMLAPHYGKEEAGKSPGEVIRDVQLSTRLGAEIGADVIKTPYTGDAESFRKVVGCTPVPVVIAGGPRMDTDAQLLTQVKGAMSAGAGGICIGRNVWQHRDPRAMLQALCAIVHQDAEVSNALAML